MSNMKDLAINNRITLQSHSINALKVLMILFVIYIHMNPTSERCGEVAMWWHSVNIVAVPVFFIISGYFFFYQVSEFTCDSYRKKLKKRMRSLLLPYFLWNLLPVLLITGGNLYSILFRGKSFEALKDFYSGLWNEGLYHIWWDKTSGTMPFDSPLWYIRDLMMVCVLSPLLYQAIKRVGWAFLEYWSCFISWDYGRILMALALQLFAFSQLGQPMLLRENYLSMGLRSK